MENFVLLTLIKIFIFNLIIVIFSKITMTFFHFVTLLAKESIPMMMCCSMCVMQKRDA
jgi:hypothetical protein